MAVADSASVKLEEFKIPTYILTHEAKVENVPEEPNCPEPNYPVIVFINSKSGGQLGGNLLVTFRKLLNEKQVFDLGEEAPDQVLRRIYVNLEKLKISGDELAVKIQERLKLIVAGGDGTAAWLLGVVSDLKLSHSPPIATVPLGTGNNLPFSFGWGKKNPGTDENSVKLFLGEVMKAKAMQIDSWHIIMRMKTPKHGSCDPIAPLELPHSLHAFHRCSETDELNVEGCHTFRGGFWNYFSMGMDAQVSYAFHSERKLHPEKFKNQFINQEHSTTCKSKGYEETWFLARTPHTSQRELTPPFVDDGLLEIVGFRNAWHGLVLLAPNGHGTRLAQAHRIRFEFHKGACDHTFMRIDGEPWKQPLPVDDDTVVVEISHLGQVNMLATHDCRSKSIKDPKTTPSHHNDEEEDSNEEDSTEDREEFRKFGAADTFKIPDEIDLSHLS